jgi:hypothetical protein
MAGFLPPADRCVSVGVGVVVGAVDEEERGG